MERGSDLVSLSSSSSEEQDSASGMEHPTTNTALLPDSEVFDDPTSTNAAVLNGSTLIRSNPNSYDGIITVGSSATGVDVVQNCSSSSMPSHRHPSDSIYQLFDKSKLTVPDFESAGLLFAKSSENKFNLDLLGPADELAAEVASEVQVDQPQDILLQPPAQGLDSREIVTVPPAFLSKVHETWIAPIDPGTVLEMERSARHVATDLMHVMDNLRNSLHAMTVCTKNSMHLHRECIDNLHSTVDANIKMMYMFMAKFDELHKSFTPLQLIAQQIHEMDENLKVLEKNFC